MARRWICAGDPRMARRAARVRPAVSGHAHPRTHPRDDWPGMMKVDAMGFPFERKGYYFYSRRRADEQHASSAGEMDCTGKKKFWSTQIAMSADQMTGVHIVGISRDGSVLAYGVRHGGEDQFSINLMDVASRRDLPDRLPRARYSNASWKLDGSGFYYSIRTDQGPRVRFHLVGISDFRRPRNYSDQTGDPSVGPARSCRTTEST